MKTGRILAALEPGDVLVVETTDPLAPLDIAHLCRERGHTIDAQEAADGVTRFTIRRGPSAE